MELSFLIYASIDLHPIFKNAHKE